MAYQTKGLASKCVASPMQHNMELRLDILRQDRCCIAVACGTKRLASVCYITNRMQRTTELGPLSEVRKMLHHCGLWNEWVIERVYVASPWAAEKKGLASVCGITDRMQRPWNQASLWPMERKGCHVSMCCIGTGPSF